MNNLEKLSQLTKDLVVLYIEDDLQLRQQTTKMLANLFKNIDTAQNGKEGWEKYQEYYQDHDKYYDLVISDIKMPIMDGVILSKKILDIHKKQIIVITSAHDESKYLIEFINMNINKFILKPFNLNTITTIFLELFETDSNILSNISIDEDYYWNQGLKKLYHLKEEVKLSYSEIEILNVLIKNRSKIFSNTDLLYVISTPNLSNELTEDTVKSAIKRLRKKLPKDTISNIYGQGYSIKLVSK